MPFGNVITVRRRPRPAYIRYTVAVFVVVATLWLRVALTPFIGEQTPYISFFLTVVWSSWFGGIGPGILATMLSAIGGWYFVVSATGVDIPQQTSILLFIGQGLLISYFV